MRLFVSHSSADYALASQVADRLRALGHEPWLAPREIRGGEDFAEQIMHALDESQGFLLLLTPAANDSPHVKIEIGQAISRRLPILPLLLDHCVLSRSHAYYLSHTQWIDARAGLDPHWPEIAAVLNAWGQGERPARGSQPPLPVERARPRLAWAAGVGAATIAIAVGLWKFAPRAEPAPENVNQVGRIGSVMVQTLGVWDRQFLAFDRYLDRLEARENEPPSSYPPEQQASARQMEADHARAQITQAAALAPAVPADLMAWAGTTSLEAADLDALPTTSAAVVDDLRNNVAAVAQATAPESVLAPATRRRLLALYRKWNQENATMLWYSVGGFLAPLNQESDAFRRSFREPLSLCSFLATPARPWIADRTECEHQSKASYERLQGILQDIATLVGDQQRLLDREEAAILPLVQKEAALRAAQTELEAKKARLAEVRSRLLEKCRLDPADDPGLMWGKILHLLNAGMEPDAVAALDAFARTCPVRPELPDPVRIATVARAFLADRVSLKADGGVIVMGFEAGAAHPDLQIGDIITELGGEPVADHDGFVRIRQGKTNALSARVLRFESAGGTWRRLQLDVPPEPRINAAELVGASAKSAASSP
jgi:hypothetical protein